MPFEKIESVEDAIDALCEGAYIKVGDRYVNPAKIAWVKKDSNGQAEFGLNDGTTVTHNRFGEGGGQVEGTSAGDFLYEALARRGRRYVETRKPAFNRLALAYGQDTIFDNAGNAVLNLGELFHYMQFDIGNGFIFGSDQSELKKVNLNDGTKTSIDTGLTDPAFALDRDNKTIFIYDSGPRDLIEINYDGSGRNVINSNVTPNGTQACAVDVGHGAAFVLDMGNSDLVEVPLDGSAVTAHALTTHPAGDDKALMAREDTNDLFMVDAGGDYFKMDYTATEAFAQTFDRIDSAGTQPANLYRGRDEIVTTDAASDEVLIYDIEDVTTVKSVALSISLDSPGNEGIAIGLDESAI